jgi:linoleoyl-CoA desaturase
MGFGTAGIGLSIMHDANHGSYSKKKWINNLLGFSLNLIGGHSFNWRVQHNVLHHTYTNIHEVDEDISPRGVIRMCPESIWRPIHKYQHFYAWFLYGLLTFIWILFKDFVRLVRYQKDGLVKKQKASLLQEWIILIITKTVYITYMFLLPLLVTPFSFWQIFLGFFVMHYIAGFILAIIFQPAHVIEGTAYPMPDETGNLENNWAIHQMLTTTNFGHREKLFSWYVGGLNYQVEHHLFPNICHVHYRQIAPIVEKTAKEFGVPYKSQDTFLRAIAAHARLLKELGVRPRMLKPMPVMA